MAVNKITNKGVVNKELVNRANEVSTKSTTIRGNRETSFVPGNNFSDNFSITLKDVGYGGFKSRQKCNETKS